MTAIYDRRSGSTHLVAEGGVAVVDALADGDADVARLVERLDASGGEAAVAARLTELIEAGLVERL